jgi:hypothetical protein
MADSTPRIAARGVSTLTDPHSAGVGEQQGADRHQQSPNRQLSARSPAVTLALSLALPPTRGFHERL